MLHDESISRFRSEVIERTINIEWIMNAIISQHYFGKLLESFLLEVLYDEYFSFALKRRILEKIIPNLQKKKVENLNRVNTIRNYFAHCNQLFIEGSDPANSRAISKVVDPRKTAKAINFKELHSEFAQIAGPLEIYLSEIFKDKGGQMKKADNWK